MDDPEAKAYFRLCTAQAYLNDLRETHTATAIELDTAWRALWEARQAWLLIAQYPKDDKDDEE